MPGDTNPRSDPNNDSGVQDPRLSTDDHVTDGPGHKAIAPAPSHQRQKQRGGTGPDETGRHPPAPRPKQRGGSLTGDEI